MPRYRLYGLASLLGASAFVASVVAVHGARAEVDWTTHYVSDFANGRLGWLFVLGTAVHGIGNLALGLGLRRALGPQPLGGWAARLFALAAAGILAAAFVAADPSGYVPTAAGIAHRAVVAVSFVVELAALFMFSTAFAASPGSRTLGRVSFALAGLAAIALGGFALAVLASRLPGLAERLALAGFLAWEVWAAFTLLHWRSPSRSPM